MVVVYEFALPQHFRWPAHSLPASISCQLCMVCVLILRNICKVPLVEGTVQKHTHCSSPQLQETGFETGVRRR